MKLLKTIYEIGDTSGSFSSSDIVLKVLTSDETSFQCRIESGESLKSRIDTNDASLKSISLLLRPEDADPISGFASLLLNQGIASDARGIRSILQAIWSISTDKESFLLHSCLEKLAESAICAIANESITSDRASRGNLVENVIRFMEGAVEANISLSDISTRFGVTQEHLIRTFRKDRKTSPMKFYAELRMRHAMKLLMEGSSISEITARMDFYNESYFCKLFKTKFGCTPGSYAKKSQLNGSVLSDGMSGGIMTPSLLQEFINAVPDLFFVKDRFGVNILCNKAFAEYFGYEPEQICGRTDDEIYPEELASFFKMSDRIILDSGDSRVFRKRFARHGKRLILETRKTPFRDEDGNILGIICIGRQLVPESEVLGES